MWWNNPDRWVDSDMQRKEWLRFGRTCLIIAVVITATAITLGVAFA